MAALSCLQTKATRQTPILGELVFGIR